MPKFRVTLQDGRTFEIVADTPPTEAEIMAQVGSTPQAQTEPKKDFSPLEQLIVGGSQGQGEALPQNHTVLETTMGLLNTVPRVLEGGATNALQWMKGKESLGTALTDTVKELNPYSKTTGETLLEEAGMDPGIPRYLGGLAMDLAAPIGPAGKVIGLGVKGAGKVIGKGTELALANMPANTADALTKAGQSIEKSFVQFPGMNKLIGRSGTSAEDYLRLREAMTNSARSDVRHKLAQIFQGTDEAQRLAIADHMNDPLGYPLAPELMSKVDEAKKLAKDEFQQELAVGQQQKYKTGPTGELLLKKPEKVPTGPQGILQRPEGPAAPISTEIENYFPWVFKNKQGGRQVYEVSALNADNPFAKERSIKTWEQAKEHGALVDPVSALEKRITVGQRAINDQDLYGVMAQEFGTSANGPLPKGYRTINLDKIRIPEANRTAMLKNVAFPEKLADELEKNKVFWADQGGMLSLVKKINSTFKNIVTTWNPAHHANNLYGNINLMALGGMKLPAIANAYAPKTLNDMNMLIGTLGDQVAPEVVSKLRSQKLGRVTVGEAVDSAKKYNLFGSSEFGIELDRAIGKTKGKIGKITDDIRYTSSRYVEDPAKWALFKDQLLKGKTPEQAAIHVKNHLFDYSELTDVEKGIRDYGLAPFYTFWRKNVPVQLRGVSNTPNTFRRMGLVYDAPNRLNPPAQDEQDPKWMREEGYVPNPLDPVGEDGSRQMMRISNPSNDLNRLTSPRAMAANLMGPLVKTGIEAITGSDVRTGKKILGTETGYTAASPISTVMEQARMAGLPLGPLAGGAQATTKGTVIQPEKIAFVLNHIPLPWIPYAQKVAGAPGETIGTKMNTPIMKKVLNFVMQGMGLTTRDITPEQQLQLMQQVMDEMIKRPVEQEMITETGKALRNR